METVVVSFFGKRSVLFIYLFLLDDLQTQNNDFKEGRNVIR